MDKNEMILSKMNIDKMQAQPIATQVIAETESRKLQARF